MRSEWNAEPLLQCEQLTFTYPEEKLPALEQISFSLYPGEIGLLCGASGCGKTTLLRHVQTSQIPFGEREGIVLIDREPTEKMSRRKGAELVGYVGQNPEEQLVTDTVWHELAFGMESLGYPVTDIRRRTAEIAEYFGITSWFRRRVSTLSGGQKQLLNLAAVMVMRPKLLLLDEPAAQLDPIAAGRFWNTLVRLNRDFGMTILLAEQQLEEVFEWTDRVLLLEQGRLIGSGRPEQVPEQLRKAEAQGRSIAAISKALPTAIQVYQEVTGLIETDVQRTQTEEGLREKAPVSIREGRSWLRNLAERDSEDRNQPSDQAEGDLEERNQPSDQAEGDLEERNQPSDQAEGDLEERNQPSDQAEGDRKERNQPSDQAEENREKGIRSNDWMEGNREKGSQSSNRTEVQQKLYQTLGLCDREKNRRVIEKQLAKQDKKKIEPEIVLEAREVSFGYEGSFGRWFHRASDVKSTRRVLEDFSIRLIRGEIYALLGGNGSGKTTALKVLARVYEPLSGTIRSQGRVLYMAQNPQSIFSEVTVWEELAEAFEGLSVPVEEIRNKVEKMLIWLELHELQERNPMDLSGGQQQRLALGKLLLLEPDILLLDEPTKGLDAAFKEKLLVLLRELSDSGMTIVLASHDIEFCALMADRCGLLFDGQIICSESTRDFLTGNLFFTTAARRMSEGILPDCILCEDIVDAFRNHLICRVCEGRFYGKTNAGFLE